MKKIFLTDTFDTIAYPTKIPHGITNIYAKINRYRDTVLDYYHSTHGVCKNSNVLVQIIKTLDVNPNWEDNEIIKYVEYNTGNIIRPLKLSDDIQVTCLSNNATIVPDASEVLYVMESKSTLELLAINNDNYRSLSPVIVTNHPYIDLYANHPNRIIDADKTQLITYTIDIPELIIMYKCYCNDMDSMGLTISIAEFVYKYVMANIIPSWLDIAIVNNYLSKGMVMLPNRHTIVDPSIKTWARRLSNSISGMGDSDSLFIVELLKGRMPLPRGTVFEALRIRGFYENRKSRIYLILTMYQFLSNILLKINPYNKSNSRYTEQLKYDIDVIENTNISHYSDKILMLEYDKTLGMIRSIV